MKVQDGEKVLHELKPEKNILWIWLFAKALPVGIFGGMAGFGLSTIPGILFDFSGETDSVFIGGIIVVIVGGLLGLGLAMIYLACLRRTYIYYVTNQRCVFQGGIIKRIERSVYYHKVTDVERSQNIIERILGISKLNIFTPGTSSRGQNAFEKAEISFVGLKDNEAPAETINGILRKFRATGE